MTINFCTGYEHGVSPVSQNGTGLSSSTSGTPSLVTSPVHSGVYALNIVPDGTTAQYIRHQFDLAATPAVGVCRFYFRASAWNNNNSWTLGGFQITTASVVNGIQLQNDGSLRGILSGASDVVGPTLNLNQWYMLEIRLDVSGTTWSLDWKVDGVSQTSSSSGGHAADTLSYLRLGSSSSTFSLGSFFFDDMVMGNAATDYPIGGGGTELIKPTSDGTHNAGTNIMESNTGADIGVVTAWDLIDAIPMSTATTYIQQLANGTGNYAEVLFGNILVPHSSIIGATALLAYTSATTTANNGGCILSKDSFSTQTVLWGVAGALADYSDGSTSNLYYKKAFLANVFDDITVNNLKARMGYSGDASPDPYWVNLAVEVAYRYPVSELVNINQATNRAAVI